MCSQKFIGSILLLIFLSISQVTLAQNAKKLRKLAIGEWQLIKIEGEDDPEIQGTFFIIGEDGSLKLKARNREKEGSWNITDDGKRFQIIEGEKVVEDMKIDKLTTQDFIISQGSDGEKVIFQRFDPKKAKALQKEYTAKIIGKWEMTERTNRWEEREMIKGEEIKTPEEVVEEKELREEFSEITGEEPEEKEEEEDDETLVLLFSKDGTVKAWENGKPNPEESTWEIDELTNILFIKRKDDEYENQEGAMIEKLNDKELILRIDGGRMIFKKI